MGSVLDSLVLDAKHVAQSSLRGLRMTRLCLSPGATKGLSWLGELHLNRLLQVRPGPIALEEQLASFLAKSLLFSLVSLKLCRGWKLQGSIILEVATAVRWIFLLCALPGKGSRGVGLGKTVMGRRR